MLKKILVVDDSDDTREMMARLLELEHFTVVTAADGRSGLHAAKTEHPDLIITDISMPDMNGIEMIKLVRESAELREVPILAVTAYGSGPEADALMAGANRASRKPLEFTALLDGINQLLTAAK